MSLKLKGIAFVGWTVPTIYWESVGTAHPFDVF
jgi:hypothetical protein